MCNVKTRSFRSTKQGVTACLKHEEGTLDSGGRGAVMKEWISAHGHKRKGKSERRSTKPRHGYIKFHTMFGKS